jgi:hypothetical protein
MDFENNFENIFNNGNGDVFPKAENDGNSEFVNNVLKGDDNNNINISVEKALEICTKYSYVTSYRYISYHSANFAPVWIADDSTCGWSKHEILKFLDFKIIWMLSKTN